MKLHLDKSNPLHGIHSCTRNQMGFEIKIGDEYFTSSLILTSNELIDWNVTQATLLRTEDFQKLAKLKADVVILGTGSKQEFPDPKTYLPLIEAGIGLEVMDTPAACRTYNILFSDDRNIVAALIL